MRLNYKNRPSIEMIKGVSSCRYWAQFKSLTLRNMYMEKALEKERKKRMLGTIPETARVVLGEYLAKAETSTHS